MSEFTEKAIRRLDERNRAWYERHKNGETMKSIAADAGLNYDHVRRIIHKQAYLEAERTPCPCGCGRPSTMHWRVESNA